MDGIKITSAEKHYQLKVLRVIQHNLQKLIKIDIIIAYIF